MKKSKQERAQEIAIEQALLKRGAEDVKNEFVFDAMNPPKKPRPSLYCRIRLKLILQWQRPGIR